MMTPGRRLPALVALLCLLNACGSGGAAPAAGQPVWLGAWMSSQQIPEPGNALPDGALDDATLRQTVRVSVGGETIRIRLSNAFGDGPMTVGAVRVAHAVASGDPRIVAGTDTPVTFAGNAGATVPAGADFLSDPVAFPVAAFDDLAISIHFAEALARQTGHPGSRTTSFVGAGDQGSALALDAPVAVDHWYQLAGVEVAARPGAAAVVVLGDSITDGRGSTTNGNDRWPDMLVRRLQANAATRNVSVLNAGIGGNRLLDDGLGPNALARLDRDVVAQPGVRYLIVLEGVNDLGVFSQREDADAAGLLDMADRIIAAYAQIAERARASGIRVYGGTILPYGSTSVYPATPETEAARARINAWIRTSGAFDAVIDFDAALRDPARPERLNPAYDSGDGLHPSPEGFRAMADAVPLTLFAD